MRRDRDLAAAFHGGGFNRARHRGERRESYLRARFDRASPFPFGPHAGTPIRELPAAYLLDLERAYRTAYPRELRAAGFLVGDRNDEAIIEAACESSLVLAAWGAEGHSRVLARARRVFDLLTCPPHEFSIECLGTTVTGAPLHPVRLAASSARRPLVRSSTL